MPTPRNFEVVELDIVSGESEWDGVFINGDLYCQNHSLYYRDVLEALDGRPHDLRRGVVRDEWLERVGRYPNKLAAIPADAWLHPLD